MRDFELGTVLMTAGVDDRMRNDVSFRDFVCISFTRYSQGDWGDTCDEDKTTNNFALEHNERILAVYVYDNETTIWIITEWDRSSTTILFPHEY